MVHERELLSGEVHACQVLAHSYISKLRSCLTASGGFGGPWCSRLRPRDEYSFSPSFALYSQALQWRAVLLNLIKPAPRWA